MSHAHQPLDVAGHADHAVEVKGPEAHAHQILAFGGGLGLRTDHRLEVGETSAIIAMPSAACAIRGSVCWVAASAAASVPAIPRCAAT